MRLIPYLSFRLALRFSQRTSVGGFELRAFVDPGDEGKCFTRIEQALQLVAAADPVRYRRMQQDLRYILIMWDPTVRGLYYHPLRLCKLHREWLESDGTPIAEVAMVLVHEATHARLRAVGIRTSRDRRIRIERLCTSAEVVFARRVADTQELISRALAMREHAERVWDSERAHARTLEALKGLRWPAWLIRAADRRSRRQRSAG